MLGFASPTAATSVPSRVELADAAVPARTARTLARVAVLYVGSGGSRWLMAVSQDSSVARCCGNLAKMASARRSLYVCAVRLRSSAILEALDGRITLDRARAGGHRQRPQRPHRAAG